MDYNEFEIEKILLKNDQLRLDLIDFKRERAKFRLRIAELEAALQPFSDMCEIHELERLEGMSTIELDGNLYRCQFWLDAKAALAKGENESGTSANEP